MTCGRNKGHDLWEEDRDRDGDLCWTLFEKTEIEFDVVH